ncbi:hypothetical protein ACFQHV_00995 [Promicromonospora thailandica]|uniref:Phage gp6-like head-tail connector protein n=1 Tax=Promicromonospora thailandica TaxID=765201 RepID=A0A9X2G9D7_9MICO|nr:hypothetical protein [Promicromonospora thailandica]MCP2265569.1 hypothetical protein [Promicromonospora thailandica]BFF17132.1 hypothetical protein GCM10025730_06530 [Promicromonospora thailandica]
MSEPAPEVTTPFVSLDALVEWMRAGQLTNEQKRALQECLDAALEWTTDKVGPLEDVARTYEVWPSGRSLVLPDTHLVAVTEVRDPDGNLVEVPARRINRLAGVIEVAARGRIITGTWTVVAQARSHGSSVRLAVKIIASHLFDTQRGRATNVATAGLMGGATPVGDPSGVPKGFAIPSRAAELLKPFLRPGGM